MVWRQVQVDVWIKAIGRLLGLGEIFQYFCKKNSGKGWVSCLIDEGELEWREP